MTEYWVSDRFVMDVAGKTVSQGDLEVRISAASANLLVLLMENAGQTVGKGSIVQHVWGGQAVSDAAITTAIKEIRRAIGDDARNPGVIQTVHREGYRFLSKVEPARSPVPLMRAAMKQDMRFCQASDGTRLALSVTGNGPPLVKAANWLNHLEADLTSPVWSHWIRTLSSYRSVWRYDERGTGLSDWDAPLSFEAFVDDLETVVDAVGLEQFDLLGISQGAAVAIAYAVRHPERVRKIHLWGGYGRGWEARANPEELARREAMLQLTRQGWAMENPAFRQMFTSMFLPDATPEQARWYNEIQRTTTSPENAVALQRVFGSIDVMELLAKVKAPTLVGHAVGDAVVPFEAGRTLASGIPNAKFLAIRSANHLLLENDPEWPNYARSVQEFLAA